MNKKITTIFWLLILNFIFVLCQMLIPTVRGLFQGSELFLVPFITFFLLGLALLILTLKNEIKQPLKKYLLLTSVSAVGVLIFIFLHNAFYALGIVAENIKILKILAEALHIAFFFISTIIAPIGFLVGVIVGIKYIIKPFELK